MSNAFTEVSHVSWFQRIGSSFSGLLFGFLLGAGGDYLLFWNEGRAVRTAQDLSEGKGQVVTISAESIDPGQEGKLVHLVGRAETDETLADVEFGVSENGILLRRQVEMYQWVERRSTETKKKLGGGEERVTTYSYERRWEPDVVNSSNFKQAGHDNPKSFDIPSQSWQAREVHIGPYRLNRALIDAINRDELVELERLDVGKFPPGLHISQGYVYRTADVERPQVGDLRIRWKVVRPEIVSLVARQTGSTFDPFPLKSGSTQQMLYVGEFTAEKMYEAAEQMNTFMTWLLRGLGFGVIWLGVSLVFRPLSVLADVVPLLGSIVRWGIGVLSFMFASVIAGVTIAVAWLYYRPLLAVAILVGVVVLILLVRMLFRPRGVAVAPAGFTPPPPPPPPQF